MESGLPPEEDEEELKSKNEEGEFFVDAREQDFLVDDTEIGVNRGEAIGVGVQKGMLCDDQERPMGEDGQRYCRRLSSEDIARIERRAKSK